MTNMCGLYGFSTYADLVDNKTLNQLHKALANYSMERGTDATGVAYLRSNKITIQKAPVPANKFRFTVPKDSNILIGHTRHTTQGGATHNYNNHPWLGHTRDNTYFAFAHNGILSNDYRLKQQFNLPKTKILTDSYVGVQLLEQQQSLDFESIKSMAEEVSGNFSFTILDNKANLYLVKGDSPLTLIHFKRLKLYVYASTSDILANALCKTPLIGELNNNDDFAVINPKCGDILCIDKSGELSYSSFHFSSNYLFDWHDYYYDLIDKELDMQAEQLIQIAEYMGYQDDDVLLLLERGYDPIEIEEIIYGGDFDEHVKLFKPDNFEVEEDEECPFDF